MNQEKYVALYSKYRPKKFSEVLGQEHVTTVLSEAIKLGNISHAYLFCGSRGTGKTSIARIFAKEIKTHQDDLYEIDAASNNSVEDIRALTESVNTLPFESKYKVYILDEVHMLSKAAFNAFLKTLEEPPKHAIFILATTEVEKIPETVISRCESYTFKKPNQKILKDMVLKTAKKEGYKLDSQSADLIALLGDGSFRDTHGILQKVINSSGDKELSVEEVEKVTGAPGRKLVNDFISAIAESDIEKGLESISKAVGQNIDMRIYLSLILEKIRAIILLRLSKTYVKKAEESFGEDDLKFLQEISANSKNINSNVLLRLLDAYDRVRTSHIAELPIEIALVEIVGE